MDYTERAVRAMYSGDLIPPIVYVPCTMRAGRKRLDLAGRVTLNPKSAEEIEQQIALADPTGFLIAVMNGQPIPAFKLSEADGKHFIETEYRIPDMMLRVECAMELARKQRRKHNGGEDAAYDARIKEAAAAFDEDQHGV